MHLVIFPLGGVFQAALVCWWWAWQPSQVCDPQNLTQLFQGSIPVPLGCCPGACPLVQASSRRSPLSAVWVAPRPSAHKPAIPAEGAAQGHWAIVPAGSPGPTSAAGCTSREGATGCSPGDLTLGHSQAAHPFQAWRGLWVSETMFCAGDARS